MEALYDLDQLLDDMEDVYSVEYEDTSLYLPPDQLRKDLHCAVKLRDDSKWYRATVTGLQEDIVSSTRFGCFILKGQGYNPTEIESYSSPTPPPLTLNFFLTVYFIV